MHKIKDLLKLINTMEAVSYKHKRKVPTKEPNTSKVRT